MMDLEEKKLELVENRDALELVPTWSIEWWWYPVAGVILIFLVLLLVLIFRKRTAEDQGRLKKEAYERAVGRLKDLEGDVGRGVAVEVSVALRRYLAESLGEPALYETHEEFVSRHGALDCFSEDVKQAVGRYFGELAEIKYGPEKPGRDGSYDLTGRGRNLLERMHAA